MLTSSVLLFDADSLIYKVRHVPGKPAESTAPASRRRIYYSAWGGIEFSKKGDLIFLSLAHAPSLPCLLWMWSHLGGLSAWSFSSLLTVASHLERSAAIPLFHLPDSSRG